MRRSSPRPGPPVAPSSTTLTIEEIVREHFPLVTACVARTLGAHYGPADVEDVAAEAWLEIHCALPRYDPLRRIQGWIYRIAQRTAAHHRRRDARARRIARRVAADDIGPDGLEGIADRAPNPEELMARHELRAWLDSLIASLPEDDRAVLDMRLCGLSMPDMAEALGLPLGTISSRMRHAEAALEAAAKRQRTARRARHGVVMVPLLMSDVIERVGADVRRVPEGMRARVMGLLRARMVVGSSPVSTPPLATPASTLGAGAGTSVVGILAGLVGALAALAAILVFLLAQRRPSPPPVAAVAGTDAPGSATSSAPVALASLPAAPVVAAPPSMTSMTAASSAACSASAIATAAPASAPVRPAPVEPDLERRALVRAFYRAIAARTYDEACAKLADYDAHHFSDSGVDADRDRMSALVPDAGACHK